MLKKEQLENILQVLPPVTKIKVALYRGEDFASLDRFLKGLTGFDVTPDLPMHYFVHSPSNQYILQLYPEEDKENKRIVLEQAIWNINDGDKATYMQLTLNSFSASYPHEAMPSYLGNKKLFDILPFTPSISARGRNASTLFPGVCNRLQLIFYHYYL